MFGFDLDTTTAPAVDWGNRAMPPVVPAGADLVMKAVHDAGLAANGQHPAMNEVFAHYAEEGHQPPVEAEWLRGRGAGGVVLDAIPSWRGSVEEQVKRTYARHLKKDEFVKIRDDCYRDRTEEHERVCEEPATVFPNGVFKARGMSVDDCVRIFQTGMHQQATGHALAQQVSNGTAETATQGYDFTTSGPTGSVKLGRSRATTMTRAGDVNTDTVVTTVPPFKGSYQECQDLAVSSTREPH